VVWLARFLDGTAPELVSRLLSGLVFTMGRLLCGGKMTGAILDDGFAPLVIPVTMLLDNCFSE
jgi:hypothetical protein